MLRKKWRQIIPCASISCLLIATFFTCMREKDNPVGPGKNDEPLSALDTLSLNRSVDTLATLCASGDRTAVLGLMTESARTLYGDVLDSLSNEELKKIAIAIDQKKAVLLSPTMAEYELVIDGFTYTISFTQGESEGSWNIVQF